MTDEQTVFDQILDKKVPATVVYEDEFVLAFQDVDPQAPTHVLVIPKNKKIGFADLKEIDATEVGEYIKRVSLIADKLGLEKNGYRIVFNHGRDGQQTVQYIHAHILGGRPMEWPPG